MMTFEVHAGASAVDLAPDMARLHVACLSGWPYFTNPDVAYHARAFRNLLTTAGDTALVVTAKDGSAIVGTTAGARMLPDGQFFAAIMKAKGLSIRRTYWITQMTILPEYRGSGASNSLSYMREDYARGTGLYQRIAFSAIVRPDDHPLKPAGYVPYDEMWNKRGYFRVPDADVQVRYADTADAPGVATEKTLQLWIKELT